MAINWDEQVGDSAVNRITRLVREAPRSRALHRGGLEGLEVLNRDDDQTRIQRRRDDLARRFQSAPAAGKPDPDVAAEVVKGAQSALAKVDDPGARFSLRERIGLEAVIVTDGTRPSLTVNGGFVDLSDPAIGEWDAPLNEFRNAVEKVISAVGRINIPVAPGFAGTGFVVARGLAITNRHVLEIIAKQDGNGDWRLNWPEKTTMDFIAEDGAAPADTYPVSGVKFAGPDAINEIVSFPHLDAAVLAIEADARPNFPAAVKLEKTPGALSSGRDLYVVGFPGQPRAYFGAGPPPPGYETSAILSSLFNAKFGVKKLAPGRVDAAPGVLANDTKAWVFSHDASTLGGNSGSAVVDLGSNGGSVIGLHFGGMSREQN
jgi:trypsin-like peptidase